jgi:hypothetical protein
MHGAGADRGRLRGPRRPGPQAASRQRKASHGGRQQQGFRASATGVQNLGNYQEARIRHFQMIIDKYLAAE